MKKSLIALAVASAVAAPAFAATSNVDVYGVINVAVQDTNATDNTMSIVDNVSRIGFKGSEDLGGGLKAIWQIESGLSGGATEIGNGVGTGALASRNTFVGLSGGFGTVLMGRHDTPYKMGTGSLDIFADTIGDYNGGGDATVGVMGARLGSDTLLSNAHDHRSPQALAYVSPTWSGFHFAVASVHTNAGGNGASASDDTTDAISATFVYSNGPLFASYSHQSVDNATTPLGTAVFAALPGLNTAGKSTGNKIGASYTFGDAKIGGVYEWVKVSDMTAANADLGRKVWMVNGSYAMGPITLKAQYGKVSYGKDFSALDDSVGYALGADYALSKRTTAYAVYASMDNDDLQAKRQNGFNLGVKHTF